MDDDSSRRPKRQSSSKLKKMELLTKMRDTVKGGKKYKYEVGELDSVYEEVDEREYSRKVLQRQEDDWIVDDDGCGYVEDGREIFDDDLDEVSMEKSKKDSLGKKRSRSAIEPPSEGKKGNIRNMLVSMPTKKKKNETAVKLDEDNLLGSIMSELDEINSTPKSSQKSSFTSNSTERELSNRDYMQALKFKRKKVPEKRVLNDQFRSMTSNSDLGVDNFSQSPIKSEPLSPITNGNSSKATSVEHFKEGIVSQTSDYGTPHDIKEEPIAVSNEDLFEGLDENNLGDLIDNVSRENTPGKGIIEKQIKDELESTKKHTPAKSLNFLNAASPKPKIKDCISEDWEESVGNESPPVNIEIDKSNLPLEKNKNGEDVFRFYYWDANEEIYSKPGTVFLFGKTYIESAKAYVSCCVTVSNIERRIFLHPRYRRLNLQTGVESSELISMVDVYKEFNEVISGKFKIKSFKSRKTSKKYAFNKEDVLRESEYLEVRYSANLPALPNDLEGETFSCVFGTNTSFLELLILDRGLKGPGWIDITNAEPNQVAISWCKVEVSCSKASDVVRLGLDEKSDIPPVVMMTMVPYSLYNAKKCQSEVVAVACLVNSTYPVDKPPPQKLFNQHFCVMTRPSDIPWPFELREAMQKFSKTHVEKMESERGLLNYLLTKIYKIDPDIIIGHDLVGFGIDIIIDQLKVHNLKDWSRLGRLRRTVIPMKAKERVALTGRLLCDIKLSAKEFIRSRSYDLDTLCQNVLHFPENKRPEMNEDLFKCSYNSGESLLNALWTLMSDASYILRIFAELNILPLCLQISNIAGNVMSRTLMGGRAERNEYLLLHAFHAKGYIVPDKEYKKPTKKVVGEGSEEVEVKVGSRKKPAYAGGLVLDPKIGLYDDLILLMDFNSLYPSIIQEYNICFTTINCAFINMEDDDCIAYLETQLPDDSSKPGILPTEIRKLVESRREVKNMLKRSSNLSVELRMQYDIRQMALKLTANSMYGCLGFSHSRFYAKPLAAIVTEKGREILMNTKRLVESYGHEVIYGDTDSLMINTRTKEFEKVFQIGKKIKTDVNKSYKQVELDIDGVFKHMLLLKKKKYAAITVSKLPNGELIEKKEIKGLDMVRRDWSQLSSEIGKCVLDEILKDQSPDDRIEAIHSYLETVKEELTNGKVPLSLLAVTKQLSKAPEKYSDTKTLPHVQVALRLNQASAKRFKQGDTVSYVVCDDGTENPAMQRAYHIEELKNSEKNLKIDTYYYLSQQIFPVIARLCDPIEGTDGASIARSLGLDPTAYRQKSKMMCDDEDENLDLLLCKKESERYKNCERLSFICENESCKKENIIEGPTRKLDNGVYIVSLEKCVNPECNTVPLSRASELRACVIEKMKKHNDQFNEGWVLCDDSICGFRRQGYEGMKFEDSAAFPVCPVCNNGYLRKEITTLQLYNQLSYYLHIFDLSKVAASKRSKIDEATQEVYNQLVSAVNEVLKNNPYYKVKLDFVFSLFASCTLKAKGL